MPENHAAFITARGARPLAVQPAPYTRPGPGEIVVRNRALAINIVDLAVQICGDIAFGWIKYPCIAGNDVAGEVVEVGSGDEAAHFAVSDRVVGQAMATDKRVDRTSHGAFQEYTVLHANLAAKIPASLAFEQVSVLPLALSTAACGLFLPGYLALRLPTSPPQKPTGEALVVWGGSTSVGSNAIQLARAAGYDVITTASPKNYDYVKLLGAAEAFDYKSATAVKDIVASLKGRRCAGALAIGDGSLEACIDIVAASDGRKFIAQASAAPIGVEKMSSSLLGMLPVLPVMGWWTLSVSFKAKRKGVDRKFIWGGDLVDHDKVAKAVYADFLPKALASGEYVAAPDAMVVGKGLEAIQEGLDVCKKGVSAKKVVVSM